MCRRHESPIGGARSRLELDTGDRIVEEDGEPVSADPAHRGYRDVDRVAHVVVVDEVSTSSLLAVGAAVVANVVEALGL